MHCGVQIVQHGDGTIILNHSEYCMNMEQIPVSAERSDKEPVSENESQQLQGILGAAQWRVYQTGPQHGARLSGLQSQITTATVSTLREATKLAREIYNGRHIGLKYWNLGVDDPLNIQFVAWSGAAVGNRRDYSNSGGYFIAAAEPKISAGKPAKLNPISWKAGKLPRIARSSLSAEIQAFSIAAAEEELMYIRLQWLELNGKELPIKDPASILPESPGILVTDARSLYDIVQKGPINTSGFGLKEKYSVLDMMSVFQRLRKGQTTTRWVHSDSQIADALTKYIANSSLVRVLNDGTWTLVENQNIVSSKKLRQRMKQQRVIQDASAGFFGACEWSMLLSCETTLSQPFQPSHMHDTYFLDLLVQTKGPILPKP